jgi:hypothetical protein
MKRTVRTSNRLRRTKGMFGVTRGGSEMAGMPNREDLATVPRAPTRTTATSSAYSGFTTRAPACATRSRSAAPT